VYICDEYILEKFEVKIENIQKQPYSEIKKPDL